MIAVLVFAGLRISELCSLRWRDVDLAGSWITVGDAKTDAGRRRVRIRGALRDELTSLRGHHKDTAQDAYVLATITGGPVSADNFRSRVLEQQPCSTASRSRAQAPSRGQPSSSKRMACRRRPRS